MITQNQLIMTAQPEFARAAMAELGQLDKQFLEVEELAPGIILCQTADASALARRAVKELGHILLFVRHLAPAQASVGLTNTEQDIGTIATELAALPSFALLERGTRFAVQSRFVQSDKSSSPRSYSGGQLNQSLAQAFAEETGAIESIKKPQVVVSLLCTKDTCYLGISTAEENLSSWPGGMRHYAHTTDQISRAEFKLLEALEVFGLSLPARGQALDLGAAPGGWTHILLEANLHVVAVDPARLDPRLAGQKYLQHYRGYAENYLEEALKKGTRFDVIVNDMRMDARDAARLLAQAARCLSRDGFIVSVLKLPHSASFDPLATLWEAQKILSRQYNIVQTRQLFHNRQEVTVVAAQPLLRRK